MEKQVVKDKVFLKFENNSFKKQLSCLTNELMLIKKNNLFIIGIFLVSHSTGSLSGLFNF